jgi:hypothetical protein
MMGGPAASSAAISRSVRMPLLPGRSRSCPGDAAPATAPENQFAAQIDALPLESAGEMQLGSPSP